MQLRAEIDQEVADHRSRIVKVEERVLAKEEEIDGKLTSSLAGSRASPTGSRI